MKLITKSQIDNVQPEPKPNSELLSIAPTSSPTIGNTLVSRRSSISGGSRLPTVNNLPISLPNSA
jgi:hypothetical protein